MTKCTEFGCRNVEWKCADCGRVVMTGVLENMGEWVSVEDRLPLEREIDLVSDGKKVVNHLYTTSEDLMPLHKFPKDLLSTTKIPECMK